MRRNSFWVLPGGVIQPDDLSASERTSSCVVFDMEIRLSTPLFSNSASSSRSTTLVPSPLPLSCKLMNTFPCPR